MDFVKILKRSFRITVRHKALWLFGFFLALFGGSRRFGSGGGGSPSFSSGGNGSVGPVRPTPTPSPYPGGPQWPEAARLVPFIVAIIVAIFVFVVLLVIALTILQALARTALIGMVNEVEETEQTSVRSGFRILWSRRGLRLLLAELLGSLAWLVIAPPLVITALLPATLAFTGNVVLIVIGVLVAIILLLIVAAILSIAGIAYSMVMEIVRRKCVLEENGVIEAIRASILTVRHHLTDVGLMWLLMTGISIAWSILMFPVGVMCIILSLFIGGPPALLAYAVFRSWIAPLVVGLPLFMTTMILTISFIEGLYLVFQSSAWTLTYREIRAREIATTNDEGPPAVPEAEPVPA